jgi:hypothetical protein
MLYLGTNDIEFLQCLLYVSTIRIVSHCLRIVRAMNINKKLDVEPVLIHQPILKSKVREFRRAILSVIQVHCCCSNWTKMGIFVSHGTPVQCQPMISLAFADLLYLNVNIMDVITSLAWWADVWKGSQISQPDKETCFVECHSLALEDKYGDKYLNRPHIILQCCYCLPIETLQFHCIARQCCTQKIRHSLSQHNSVASSRELAL